MNHETLGEAPADALTAVDDAADSVVESGISSGKGGGEKTRSMSEGVEAATAISSQVKGINILKQCWGVTVAHCRLRHTVITAHRFVLSPVSCACCKSDAG